MKRPIVVVSLASPMGVGPAEMDKIVRLASGMGAELELFYCVHDPKVTRAGRFGVRGAQEEIHQLVERRRQQLEQRAEPFRARGVTVRTSVRWDYPVYEGIVRHVLRRKPSLLIAQSARRARTARLMLTQTDYKLIESCPCPVLFIKNTRPYSAPVIVSAVDPKRAHGKPATLDDGILDSALTVRDALGGTLRMFHAGAPWEYALHKQPELRDLPESVREDVRSGYWNAVRKPVLALARRHKVAEECVDVLEGEAGDLLPQVARSKSAAIVALGAVSRSRIGRALIGHTAERVLDELDCDVLVVKPPDFRTQVKRESTHHIERSAAHRSRYVV